MLEELRVLNGEMTPKYDKYNNKYTITVANNVSKVKFEFKKDENTEVIIYGNNNIKVGENNIVLLVKNNDQSEYIFINVIKQSDADVMEVFDSTNQLEIANSVPIYSGYLIATSCFLIILLLFLRIFGRKNKA